MGKKVVTLFALDEAEKSALQKQFADALFLETLPEQFRKLQAEHDALRQKFTTLTKAHISLLNEHESLKKQLRNEEYSQNDSEQSTFITNSYGDCVRNEEKIIGLPTKHSQVGEIVRFGKYEWYVIQNNGLLMTLLCADIVCQLSYYKNMHIHFGWANSLLHHWLNKEFYQTFSAEEKGMIVCGHGVSDAVYLLSLGEAEKINASILSCSSWWWLRSVGKSPLYAAGVYAQGVIDTSGKRTSAQGGVRPAITINI